MLSINDAGTVAGHLFSLGQHTQDTPAFKLLKELTSAYKLELDFDEGVVKTTTNSNTFVDRLMDLVKVIVTMITATPHIRIQAHRFRLFGPRLRTKIRKHYSQRHILRFVEHDYEIGGQVIKSWPIDFHWRLSELNRMREVFIVAVDLNVQEPLRKAERVTAFALDTYRNIRDNDLRIVMDRHGHNSTSDEAAEFLREHSKKLSYNVYDFEKSHERESFLQQSADELLGDLSKDWREIWGVGSSS